MLVVINVLFHVFQVFTRFVDEGKATIRFCRPPHDLCVSNADVVALKAFLNVLKKVLELKPGQDDQLEKLIELNMSALVPATTSQVTKEKTKLVITNKKDYPITTNFPHTLKVNDWSSKQKFMFKFKIKVSILSGASCHGY